jgi:drug/metabolite transporter (DMT)-like permease
MTSLAVGMVLVAAFMHAFWNFLSKQVNGGTPSVWLFSTVGAVMFAPLALYIIFSQQVHFTAPMIVAIVGSAILHIAYFTTLQHGYKVGDLSLIYPLARGTGPLLSTLLAIVLFAERPSVQAFIGALFIIGGVFLLTGGTKALEQSKTWVIGYGLLTGIFIAMYTLWDKNAVAVLFVPPIILDYASMTVRAILLTPYAMNHQTEVKHLWKTYPYHIMGIAFFSSIAYILVLTAMQVAPVSYVAPMREVSILIGVLLGAQFLKEGNTRQRATAALAIVVGVIAIALG